MPQFDALFGIHSAALGVQRQRMELIAGNIANADTPGYQARDVDFRAVLAAVKAPARPDAQGAASAAASATESALREASYRLPMQPAADGNTVELQVEQAQFADAAMRYQASLQFIEGRMGSLMTALTGQ